LPSVVFLFGLDTTTAQGRPTLAVPLVSVPAWTLGPLSTDVSEGKKSVPLPLAVGIQGGEPLLRQNAVAGRVTSHA